MKMTLEEAIDHCEEVAEEEEKQAIWLWRREGNPNYQNCVDRAKKQRQLAEWLRELKAYRKAENEIEQELVNWNDIDNGKCRGLFLATSIIQHYKNEEVNADED